jgi:hypothetical protein
VTPIPAIFRGVPTLAMRRIDEGILHPPGRELRRVPGRGRVADASTRFLTEINILR